MQIREKWKYFTLRPPARKRREILQWAIKGEKSFWTTKSQNCDRPAFRWSFFGDF